MGLFAQKWSAQLSSVRLSAAKDHFEHHKKLHHQAVRFHSVFIFVEIKIPFSFMNSVALLFMSSILPSI